MIELIQRITGNDIFSTILMSLVPLIELKGGIVFARGVSLSFFQALFYAYVGSTAAFFPVFFLFIPFLNLLKKIKFINGLAVKIENYFAQKSQKALDSGKQKGGKIFRGENFYKKLGVFIFVAIPLPMTGVWTGTAIAVFLNLKFKDAVFPVVLGNLVAGIIISLLSALLIEVWTIAVLDYILYGLFILAVIMLIITIVKVSASEKGNREQIK